MVLVLIPLVLRFLMFHKSGYQLGENKRCSIQYLVLLSQPYDVVYFRLQGGLVSMVSEPSQRASLHSEYPRSRCPNW